MKKSNDRKKAKGRAATAPAVELGEKELGDLAGGGGATFGGTITLDTTTAIGNRGTIGDGTPDIIVAAGPGGGPHIK